MNYIHGEQFYSDLYDLSTIKLCLETIEIYKEVYKKSHTAEEINHLSEEEILKGVNIMLNRHLYFQKAHRYKDKAARIQEWLDQEQAKQDKYDNTPEPANIICPECGSRMKSIDKSLEDYVDEPMRILFFFDCTRCKVRECFYENGEQKIFEPDICSKCSKEVERSHKRKGEVITITKKCTTCKNIEIETIDFHKDDEEREKQKHEDKELLEKYRAEYCLNDKEGKEYVEFMEASEVANAVYEEELKKYDDPVYEIADKIKKLEVNELEGLLNNSLKDTNYIKLSFEKPEISRNFIIPFTLQDIDSSRKGNHSANNLEKIFKKILKETNWRLVSGTLVYRLGYITGRLKAYETDDDLLKLLGKKEEKQTIKVDPELYEKYKYSNHVSVARFSAEYEGIERMRKRRLKKEPEGFFLEDREGGGYRCQICHESTPGSKCWWDLDGIRCADCQRNIKEGTIPKEVIINDKISFREFDLGYDFKLHSATIRKLIREGLLKGRKLKRLNGDNYFTIYMVEENQQFLKKYSRKRKSQPLYVDKNGPVY